MDNSPGSNPNVRAIFIIFLAIGILAAGSFFAFSRDSGSGDRSNENGSEETLTEEFTPISPNTIVYGAWRAQGALIKAFDLQSGETAVLAELSQNVKKISVIDEDHLLYVDLTDDFDRGKILVLYTISTGEEKTVYTASQTFGIDDYILSPDKQSVAIWELAAGEDNVLRGGRSRVYAAKITNPGKKNLIYDEEQSGETPIHYPRAITNIGDVYTDTFLPNVGKGWAYGMSVANFDGTKKEEISSMQKGTYGTQPVLSPDGRYLAFGGYDAAADPRGGGDPRQRAVLRPNTVAIFDTVSKERRKLSGLNPDYIYGSVSWDETTGDLVYTALATAKDFANSGIYEYDLRGQNAVRVNTGSKSERSANSFIVSLNKNAVLVGEMDQSESGKSSLGARYVAPFLSLSTIDGAGKETLIPLEDNMVQYLGVFGPAYFAGNFDVLVQANNKGRENKKNNRNNRNNKNDKKNTRNNGSKGGQNQETSTGTTSECTGFDNLQLCPFYFKVALAPKRQRQQSEPPPNIPPPPINTPGQTNKCDDLREQQCIDQGFEQGTDGFDQCMLLQYKELARYITEGQCEDSPLYLYGTPGQQVAVKIHTPVYNAIPEYNNGYQVTLGSDGMMTVNNGTFNSISYDYVPAIRKIVPPAKGTVVARENIADVIKTYANRLGLNENETNDLVVYGLNHVTSPYVYVSFFNHEMSQKILPITFSPEPDNYLNVVFYFRLLSAPPSFSVAPPTFPPPLNREGFTAVEVSSIVE